MMFTCIYIYFEAILSDFFPLYTFLHILYIRVFVLYSLIENTFRRQNHMIQLNTTECVTHTT